jgi:hypothetical protein
MTIKITKVKGQDNSFNLSWKGLTTGKLLALRNALAEYAGHSVVGQDLWFHLSQNTKDSQGRDLLI